MTRSQGNSSKLRVGITIGDPAGIGPEVVLRSVAEAELCAECQPVIIADTTELQRQAARLGLRCDYAAAPEAEIESDGWPSDSETLICDVGPAAAGVTWGKASAAGGGAAIRFIETAARLCRNRRLDAMATAPVNKEALKLAGSPYPGHTEMLAALCGSSQSMMCFFAAGLRVALLTIHSSLADAIKAVTRESIISALALLDRELRRFGLSHPRIAVCGLNPHAGENGLFGSEEEREIKPAIDHCKNTQAIAASGPFPADTVFLRAARGEFDVVLACYHDQGLIAVKCLAFGQAVNVTLGLPIIRTSVDHGTAFDIAGRGLADHRSMVEAIKLAARLADAERTTRAAAAD